MPSNHPHNPGLLRASKLLRSVVLVVCSLALLACGQTGPLKLPAEEPQKEASDQQ